MKAIKSLMIFLCLLVIGTTSVLCLSNQQKVYAEISEVHALADVVTNPFGDYKIMGLTQDEDNIYFSSLKKFAVFNKTNNTFGDLIPTPFIGNIVSAVVDDNNVYAIDTQNRFAIYNKSTSEFGGLIDLGWFESVKSIVQDENNIYISGYAGSSGILVYNKNTGETEFKSITYPTILSMIYDDGLIYLGCENGEFIIYNILENSTINITSPFGSSDNIQSIIQDENNVYCGSSGEGFAIYNKTSGTFGSLLLTPLSLENIRYLTQDADNIYMIGNYSSSKIETYNKNTSTFNRLFVSETNNPSLEISSFLAIFQNGNKLYATTSGYGLMVINLPSIDTGVYVVNFYDKDNNLIDTQCVELGQTAIPPTPTEYDSHTFVSWDADVTQPITTNTNFYSIYEINIYIVNFYDKDNNLISSQEIEFGQTAIPPTPTEYDNYTFVGWDNDITQPIIANTNFYAEYTLDFTISFYGKDNELVDSQYCDSPILLDNISFPTPPEYEGFTFDFWDSGIPGLIGSSLVMGDLSFHATYYETIVIIYVVTFYYINPDWETIIIDTLEVEEGDSITSADFPDAPARTGYTFQGWSSGVSWSNITQDINIHADYKLNLYPVTFWDEDNNLLDTQLINHGQCVIPPEIDNFVYFWDIDITQPIIGNTEFHVIDTVALYTINFYDIEGDLIISQKYLRGQVIESAPTPTDVIGYTFRYWSSPRVSFPDYAMSNRDYYAIYTISIYTITFINNIDNLMYWISVEHGEIITPQPLNCYGYNFLNWDIDVSQPITSDTVFCAIYEPIMYTVNFYDKDSNLLTSQQVQHGQNAVGPTPPEVEGYIFSGWGGTSQITEDEDLYAHYIIIEYCVRFYSWSDNSYWGYCICLLHIQYGQCPIVPDPVERSGYTFISWDKDVTEPIYEDTDFYSVYEPKPIAIKVYVKEWLGLKGNVSIYSDPVLVDTIIISYKEDLPDFDLSLYSEYQYYRLNQVDYGFHPVDFEHSYMEECSVFLKISKQNFEIEISYYTLERIYYTTTNMFLFVPISTETTYVNVLVYKTISQWIWAGDIATLNFNELIGYGRGGDFAYKNIPGWEFIGWDNGTEDLLPSPEHNHYVAQYRLPQVKAMYYSSNGVKVLEDMFDLTIVDILDLPSQNWLDGWIKGMADILLRFDIFGALDDAAANAKATELFNAMIDARLEKGNAFQPKILIVQPNVKINIASGIFRDSAVHIESSDFIFFAGNSLENSFAYFTDWSMAYVTGLKFEMYVYYDTIYDLPVNVTTNLLTSIRDIIVENLWLILLLFVGIPLVASFFKSKNKKKRR